jgi:hypothetical protein
MRHLSRNRFDNFSTKIETEDERLERFAKKARDFIKNKDNKIDKDSFSDIKQRINEL